MLGDVEGPVSNSFHGKFNLTQRHRPGLMRRLCRTARFLVSDVSSQFSEQEKGRLTPPLKTEDRRLTTVFTFPRSSPPDTLPARA